MINDEFITASSITMVILPSSVCFRSRATDEMSGDPSCKFLDSDSIESSNSGGRVELSTSVTWIELSGRVIKLYTLPRTDADLKEKLRND